MYLYISPIYFILVVEEQCLQQIYVDEQFGPPDVSNQEEEEKKKK